MAEKLTCDMERDCTAPVTHIDVKGYVYCTRHGQQRRAGGMRCRKMTAVEIATLVAGDTIPYSTRTS